MKLGEKTILFMSDLLRSTDGAKAVITILERVGECNGVRVNVEFRGSRAKLIVEHNGYDLEENPYDDSMTIIEFLRKVEQQLRQEFRVKVIVYHDVCDGRDWEGPGKFIEGREYNSLDKDATPVRLYDKLRVRF